MFWPGSDVKIDGYFPTYYYKYDSTVPYLERCNVILKWLSYPAKTRPTFLTLYFEEPDHTEHTYGPDDVRIDPILTEVDYYLGYLLDEMEAMNIRQYVDVIVVSDHGMTSTPTSKVILLDNYNVTVSSVSQMYNPNYQNVDGWVVSWGALTTIIPQIDRENYILNSLQNVTGMSVYTNSTIANELNWFVLLLILLRIY
jgi:predicted AlkP superfamily pyrophosphatase or phosphodiesterase